MKSRFKIDFWLLIPAVILVFISLTTLLSLNSVFFTSQLISFLVSLVAFVIFSQVQIDFIKQLRLPIYIVSVVVLSILLVIGIESRGAIRWIEVFGVSIQFSEIFKPFLAVIFASFLAEQRAGTIKSFFVTIAFLLPIVALINFQPDLGSALVYTFVSFFALLVYGFPFLWFLLLGIPFLVSAPFVWTLLHDYQRHRILTFLHPTADPLGTSYNSIQAIIAVGSGTFWGKGLSEGTQSGLRFLPERQTDFIFASIAEGTGFVGAAIVILALLALCYRVYQVYRNTDDRFIQIFAVCCFGFFVIQGFINIAMNVGYLPIVGVTLPFVSFGGSSLLANFIFLGILSSMSVSQKHKPILEIR